MPSKASAKKPGWVVVAARIPPKLKESLKNKYPNNGSISDIIYILLEKLDQGKILGVKLPSN